MVDATGADAAARICQPTAEVLSSALERDTTEEARSSVIRGLAAMSIRLSPDRAVQTVRLLATIANKAAEPARRGDRIGLIDNCLYELRLSLDPVDARRAAQILVRAIAQEQDAKVRWWLAAGLCLVAEKMDPSEAPQICGLAAKDMADALVTEKADYNSYLVSGFAAVASGLPRRLASKPARLIGAALEREQDAAFRDSLATILSSLAARMDPAEGVQLCAQAARALSGALSKETDAGSRQSLASALSSVAGKMHPEQAARLCGEAAIALADSLAKATDSDSASSLAAALASLTERMERPQGAHALASALEREVAIEVTGPMRVPPGMDKNPALTLLSRNLATQSNRLEPAEAKQICGSAAYALAAALDRATNEESLPSLASALADVAPSIGPAESSRLCDNAANTLWRARAGLAHDVTLRYSIDATMARLLRHLDSKAAQNRARKLSAWIVAEWHGRSEAQTLADVLTDTSRPQILRRASLMATGSVGQGIEAALTAIPRAMAEPFPCRLTTQDLVDLLKMPTCIGAARRVVLNHLGNRYGRRFANHWAFVRFAREQNLGLDFATPPRRPELAQSTDRGGVGLRSTARKPANR
jgi:hypothetical protein